MFNTIYFNYFIYYLNYYIVDIRLTNERFKLTILIQFNKKFLVFYL